jgi:hypothetical protein
MGEHKHNLAARYFAKHPRARHLPLSFKDLKRKTRATHVILPEGKYIVKNIDPFSCPRCGENPLMGEEDEDNAEVRNGPKPHR